MKRDLRTLAAAVVDVWNGGTPDRIRGLLTPDCRERYSAGTKWSASSASASALVL
jgi:hypothetical protein